MRRVRAHILTDLHSAWHQLQNSELPPPAEDMAKWEAEYNQLMSSTREELDYDYGASIEDEWVDGLTDEKASTRFDEEGLPILGDYVFGEPHLPASVVLLVAHICLREREQISGPVAVLPVSSQ